MARRFAGVLGVAAMAVTLVRGAAVGGSPEQTILSAVVALAAMAAVGAVVGGIAQRTVDESVRLELQRTLAREQVGTPPGAAQQPRRPRA